MKQYEAVIEVMKANGGYATLGYLYSTVLNVPGARWRTKTPFASIRRIVQDERFFFKIRPGLWALKKYKDKIPFVVAASAPKSRQEFTHAYYQGLLVEIGNLKKHGTHVPNQDKNKKYLDKPLGSIATIEKCHKFSYDRFVNCARNIDVTWFNERKMPSSFFEVEYSTNVHNSLIKFVELQDFASNFLIVADKSRERYFRDRLSYSAFQTIARRVRFMDYDTVAQIHSKEHELALWQGVLDPI